MDIGLAAKPGELALGVVAMALLGFGNSCFLADALEENGKCLAIAERVERFDRTVAGQKSAGLFDQAGGEHVGAALVQPLVEGGCAAD